MNIEQIKYDIQTALDAHRRGVYSLNEATDSLLLNLESHSDTAHEKAEIKGVLTGLRICKEFWAQGTISHEEIRENELHYMEELEKLTDTQTDR